MSWSATLDSISLHPGYAGFYFSSDYLSHIT